MDLSFPGCNANATGDGLSDEEYDLLNSETFGDVQEDFDWDAATEDPTQASNAELSSNPKLDVSIAGLVSDDEPDDPAIVSVHAKRIPNTALKESNFDMIYGPQSPPAYVSNIDSLLDPAHDIWGSPLTAGSFVTLSSSASATDTPDTVRDAYLSKSFDEGDKFPSTPVKPDSLSESPAPMPMNAMTVEELERQLGSDTLPLESIKAPPTPAVPVPHHQGPSTYHHPLPGNNHAYSPVNHQVIRPPHLNGGPTAPPSHSPAQMASRQTRPITILHRHPHGVHDPRMYQQVRGQVPQPYSQRYSNNMPGYGPRHPQMHRGGGPMPAPVMRFPGNMHPHRARMMARQGMNMMNQQHHPMQIQQRMQQLHLHQHPQQMYGGGPRRDEYAGLLTKHEKDWLVKIQMIQLHTDDPYTDDYYYTIYNIEKNEESGDEWRGRKGSAGNLVLPALAKLETKTYTPVQFEGSLGRLTSSSVHKPRQVLDVGNKTEQAAPAAVETKKYRLALVKAEKAYQLILDIDEIKKKTLSMPENARSDLESDCQSKVTSLYSIVDEYWSTLIPVRKGRSLILRTLPLVNKTDSRTLLERLLGSLGQFVKKEQTDSVNPKSMKGLDTVLSACDMTSLLVFTESIIPAFKSALKTSFGSYLILAIIKQAEQIFSAFVEVPSEQKLSWYKFVDGFLEHVRKVKSPPPLKSISLIVYDHLSKRPESKQSLSKIEHWFKKPTTQPTTE